MNILAKFGSPFSSLYVRDVHSYRLATMIGWPALLSQDFIDEVFFDTLNRWLGTSKTGSGDVLGIALRAWPGLNTNQVVELARYVANRHGLASARVFVLENSPADREFALAVSSGLHRERVPASVEVYRGANLREFLAAMLDCRVAISMKFHSSILWGYGGATIYPISYAPKTAELLGLDVNNGLQILRHPASLTR